MVLSADSLEEIVRPGKRAEFEAKKKEWLAWEKWSEHTPGLFKLGCEGPRMIALCSKCYYFDEDKAKFSTKGMSKSSVSRSRFKAASTGQETEAVAQRAGGHLRAA